MTAAWQRYSTPLTLGLFVLIGASGVAMFLHLGPGSVRAMHEWLGLALLVPAGLHVARNWNGVKMYARRGQLLAPLAASLVAGALFIAAGMFGGASSGNPAFQAAALMTQAPLSDLAPVLKTTPEALEAVLASHGFAAASPKDTLSGLASAAGASTQQVLAAVVAGR